MLTPRLLALGLALLTLAMATLSGRADVRGERVVAGF